MDKYKFIIQSKLKMDFMMSNYSFKSMTEQAIAIQKDLISPVKLVEDFFENIANEEKTNQIFTEIYFNDTLDEAKKSEKRQKSNKRKSFFDGILLNWKDLFEINKKKCEGGTQLLAGKISEIDADVYKNATSFGLITIGKTHLTEFAFSGLGVNPKTETPPNSIKQFVAPGGSSSGAAVATALNLSSAGIGSDTGGSVRIPAAWNNLVGFKPTHGKLSLSGVLKLCPNFDTVGPITKTVEDSFSLYKILKGESLNPIRNNTLKNKSFLIDTSFLIQNVCDEVKKSFQLSINRIVQSGANIKEIDLNEISKATQLAKKLFPYEAYNSWKKIIEANPEKMHPPVLERFRAGKSISYNDYLEAWNELENIRRSFLLKIHEYDAVLSPTCPITPPLVQKLLENDEYFTKSNLLSLRNTRVANLFGLTSISLPTEINCCGLMLLSKPNDEINLLETAHTIELYFNNNK